VVPYTEGATLGLALAPTTLGLALVPTTLGLALVPATVLLYFSHIQQLDLLVVPLVGVTRRQLRLVLLSEEDEQVVEDKPAG
jgi:hypothetical protein